MREAFPATNTISIAPVQAQATEEWSVTSVSPSHLKGRQALGQRAGETASNFSEAVFIGATQGDVLNSVYSGAIPLSRFRRLPLATLDVTAGKLNAFVQALIRLQLDAEEEGLTRPTEYAYERVTQLVSDAYVLMWLEELSKYSHLAKPFITTDDLGGVRVFWKHSSRILRANVGASDRFRSYLYFEEGRIHGVESLERQNLVERLKWLIP